MTALWDRVSLLCARQVTCPADLTPIEVEAMLNQSTVHPDDREGTSLDDLYTKLGEAETVLADLTVLALRHLPAAARPAENLLRRLLALKAEVLPDADPGGPF